MRRYKYVIIALCCTAAAAAALWYGISCRQARERENEMLSTDCEGYAEEDIIHADPMMVGKWQNTENPHWYKVYYDDCDEEDGLFWGKEWDESEEVFEEDLNYHGNGWFLWGKNGSLLREYATMDMRNIPIAKHYRVLRVTADSLVYCEQNNKKVCSRFARVE